MCALRATRCLQEAFSCFEFEADDNSTSASQFAYGNAGHRYLIADVAVECDSWAIVGVTTSTHSIAKIIALCAILAYAVGFWLVSALILFKARHAILSKNATALSKGATFLHREYVNESTSFWWEVSREIDRTAS